MEEIQSAILKSFHSSRSRYICIFCFNCRFATWTIILMNIQNTKSISIRTWSRTMPVMFMYKNSSFFIVRIMESGLPKRVTTASYILHTILSFPSLILCMDIELHLFIYLCIGCIIETRLLVWRSMSVWQFLKCGRRYVFPSSTVCYSLYHSKSTCFLTFTACLMRKSTSIASNLRMENSNFYLVHRTIDLHPFTHRPSSLDAYFFGHLAQVMTFPAKLRVKLQNFPNLIAYYEGIMKTYFAPSLGDSTSDNLFLVGICPNSNDFFQTNWISLSFTSHNNQPNHT